MNKHINKDEALLLRELLSPVEHELGHNGDSAVANEIAALRRKLQPEASRNSWTRWQIGVLELTLAAAQEVAKEDLLKTETQDEYGQMSGVLETIQGAYAKVQVT